MRILLAVITILVGVISCQSCRLATTSPAVGKLTVQTVALGNREIEVGAVDAMIAKLKFTADANGDVTIKEVNLTDGIDGRLEDQNSLVNVELWANLTSADSYREDVWETKISNTIQPDTALATALYNFQLVNTVVVPAGTTIELVLIGDILTNASPGSTHIIRPGLGPRDGALAVNDLGEQVPVVWLRDDDWSHPGHWPEGTIITIAPMSTVQ